jgi:dTDP-4-amino-4,6-dideoxygalactose transaminase
MNGKLEREIEAVLRDRTGRECLFVPSGRLALHLAFRALLGPGDRILMSPLEDDTVFFGALAAGLRPVMAPVSMSDGNLDVEAIPASAWSTLDGVLAMNLYGLPERVVELRARCQQLRIPLIEDAAHALETEVEAQPVGTFGDIAAFSLSKHVPGVGGVLAFADEARRSELMRLRAEVTIGRPRHRQLADQMSWVRQAALDILPLGGSVRRARQRRRALRRTAWRIPLRPTELREALATGDLGRMDPWMTTAYPDYRMPQRPRLLERTLSCLRNLEQDSARRRQGVERLRELDAAASGTRDGAVHPLLRVPLLVEERDALAAELQRRGIKVYFLYAPPLDEYAGPAFAEPSPDPSVASFWADHVLPVDPLDAERALRVLDDGNLRVAPAAHLR